jgi:hypothetical protein
MINISLILNYSYWIVQMFVIIFTKKYIIDGNKMDDLYQIYKSKYSLKFNTSYETKTYSYINVHIQNSYYWFIVVWVALWHYRVNAPSSKLREDSGYDSEYDSGYDSEKMRGMLSLSRYDVIHG